MKLTLDQALKKAIEAQKNGNTQKAEKIYQNILKSFPKNKRALDGIKILAGKTSANTSNMQKPSRDQLQRLENLYRQGQHKAAITQVSQLLKKFPNSIELYNILGAASERLGKPEDAIGAYKKALSIKPNFAEAYYNMGNALKDQGKIEDSIEAYNKAISIKPDFAQAYNNLGNALKDQGKIEGAIEAFHKAISIKPDYAGAHNNIGNALKGVTFNKPNKDLHKTIVSLLDKGVYIRPSDIAKSAVSLLKLEPNLKNQIQTANESLNQFELNFITQLNELPLLLQLMNVCPIPDLEIEKLFRELRCFILSNILSLKETSRELLEFQSALALQCFTNEYIYNYTDNEEKILKSLDANVRKALDNNNQPSPQVILALASYKALNKYDWCSLLSVTDHIQGVFSRQVEEPSEEEKIKQDLPVLEEITDSISSEVRSQYEESPYPRWVKLGLSLKPMSVPEIVNEIKLKLHDNKIYEIEKPEILVAGCGTGQHSIGTGTRFNSSKVLAIDLSLSSLAYAKRKTQDLGIKNIDYMQADILHLGQLNKQFDIIESGGVLHHMDNPMAGWKVLTDCLKPGGLMKVGLYSELARPHIVKIRQEIKEQGIGSSDAEMRSFRDMIIKSAKDHHKLITRSGDFYSLSTLRDLLFHVQEHRFTILQIKSHLDELGLKFCGFEGRVVNSFLQSHKEKNDAYELDKWQSYEEANPRTFAGMYQFWCQKV